MKNNTWMVLSGVIASAMLSACGGGGESPAEAAAAAGAAQTAASAGAASSQAQATVKVASPTGTGQQSSIAPAHPAINPSLVARVHAELDLIEQVLSRGDGGELETQEALEVVSDIRAELKKQQPNRLRLRSLLAGLARDVQVVDGTNAPSAALARLAPLI